VTREQQIRAALRLLAPEPSHRADCEGFIGYILDIIDRVAVAGLAGSKKHRIAVERFEAALRRVAGARSALAEVDLAGRFEEKPHLKFFTVSPPELDFEPWLNWCEQRLALLPQPSQLSREALAVQWAAALLRQFRQPLNKTRRGKWARLAAILAGEPTADLFHYLRTYEAPRRPNSG
jgi:hypothetical protein